ncbi:efflux RND transporter periplasmic adaptor subunit [Chitinophaga tropicalis]|uniref:Efflux RND transporter periplasmic adaptor subunit n=1 Tax=Chitinophaga tropicalis TaxID=2683588 RepID=A0A7K1U871_9BACT|nr:efflux RND transporter periplasmic adaptor subunit [Chitinophaga tropicalis]MVT10573.1 efflux RND transporter periplasmic adaptor subunit [Chitinophaga tropicalis]
MKCTYPLLAAILIFSSCGSKNRNKETTESAIPVIAEEAGRTSTVRETSVSGNIEGSQTVHLGFMVGGKVNFIAANEGQPIKEGQLLASLDAQNYSIAKEISDVNVGKAQDEFNRLKIMYERKSISESDFTKITLGLQEAKAQQKLQAKNLADTRLYSPISGVLLKKNTEVGEITAAGTPLFVVSAINTVKVNAYIPESELSNVKLGQEATVFVGALNETLTGKVTEVGAAADPASRAFMVKINLGNPGLRVRPGMIAEIKIASGHTSEILALPAEAVLHDLDNQSYVYVIDKSRNKAFKRKVSVGQLSGNRIEITSGVLPGELVVTGGQQKLNDGSSVIITK